VNSAQPIRGLKKPLIVVCGEHGSGKTTAARAIEREFRDFHYVVIDDKPKKAGPWRTPESMLALQQVDVCVTGSLRDGFGVIVDRPNRTFESRLHVYYPALAFRTPILVIECLRPESMALSRIIRRQVLDGRGKGTQAADRRVADACAGWQDVLLDLDKSPGLARQMGYIKFFTHLPVAVPVKMTHELCPISIRIFKALNALKQGDEAAPQAR